MCVLHWPSFWWGALAVALVFCALAVGSALRVRKLSKTVEEARKHADNQRYR